MVIVINFNLKWITFGRYSTLNVEMFEMLSATHSSTNLSSSELRLSDLKFGGAARPAKMINTHSNVDKVDNEYVKIKLTKHRTMGFINVWRSKKGNEIRRRHLAFLQIKMFSSFRYKPLSMMGFKICFFGGFCAKTNILNYTF